MFTRITNALLMATVLAGCASTSGLAPESSPADLAGIAASRSLESARTTPGAWPDGDWWKRFGDPQLDGLIDEALRGSPTLQIAQARTRRALAFAATTKSALYPQVNADFSSTRQRFPEHGEIPPPFAGTWNTLNDLQVTLGWELDLWGKNRAAYESALGQAQAADIDAYAARLGLSVGIAHAYVDLERAYLQLDVAERTLGERERILALTRDRYDAGIDSRVEVKQAETAVPATRERIAQLSETIDLTRNQIAALLGQGPDRGLRIERPKLGTQSDFAIPSVLPAELLGRRPDVTAQRARVEVARKDIDVAKAEFYPNVNLAAFIGLQSLGASGFLSAASRMIGFGPAISLPIFDAGRLRGNLAGRDADYDIAVQHYNQTLANAMRDVVDQLVSARSVAAQRDEHARALSSAQEAYDLALTRYREGIGNYLQVLSAEQPLLVQQSLDAELRSRELALSIDLIRALGGGFTEGGSPIASASAH